MNILSDLVGSTLASIATHLSSLATSSDAELARRLEPIKDKVVELQCISSSVNEYNVYQVKVRTGGVDVEQGSVWVADATIKATPSDLFHTLRSSDIQNLQIEGDIELLVQMASIVRDYRPTFGNVVPGEVSSFMADGALKGLNSIKSMFTSVDEHLTPDRKPDFVSRNQFDAVVRTVDNMRLEIDRLTAKFEQRAANNHKADTAQRAETQSKSHTQ